MNINALLTVLGWISSCCGHHLFYSPYQKLFRYPQPYYDTLSGYSNNLGQVYSPFSPNYPQFYPAAPYFSRQTVLPALNVLVESPYSIEKSFTVVPMIVVPRDELHVMSGGHIVSMSKKKPTVAVKTDKNTVQCTPAVKIELETPIVVYNLKTSIVFPSEMAIRHENVRIPIRVGAVIAPVEQDVAVSEESPVTVYVVYAIPTKPVEVDYVNNEKDVVVDPDRQSVSVDSDRESNSPTSESETESGVNDNGESELVNRNPPSAITTGGITQSTQPQSDFHLFHNSKESPLLTTLREEAKKRI